MRDIKPCPFCGIKPTIPDDSGVKFSDGKNWSIGCESNRCSMNPYSNWYKYRYQAINAWNRRKP